MAMILSLGSSSKGNCTYIGDKQCGIIIDAGIGIRAVTSLLKFADIDDDAVKAIFVTHEHSDHIKGLKPLTAKTKADVYSTAETLEQLIHKDAVSSNVSLFEINKKSRSVGDFSVTAFDTPHDSVHSVGYKVHTPDNKIISVCTDLGHIPISVSETISGSDFVILESNYDKFMLENGVYPWFLKKRISGDNGHLSNNDCAAEIEKLITSGTEHFMLAHLSDENNFPATAMGHAVAHLEKLDMKIENDYTLKVAPKKSIGQIIELP